MLDLRAVKVRDRDRSFAFSAAGFRPKQLRSGSLTVRVRAYPFNRREIRCTMPCNGCPNRRIGSRIGGGLENRCRFYRRRKRDLGNHGKRNTDLSSKRFAAQLEYPP